MARVNLKAIALAAGVSISTASRVLSGGDHRVTAATRDRVLSAARRLDYVPNAQALGLLHGNPRSIGVLIDDLDGSMRCCLAELHRVARAHRCRVTTVTAGGDIEAELRALDELHGLDVAAVVVMIGGHRDPGHQQRLDTKVASLMASDHRVVVVGRPGLTVDTTVVQVNGVLAGRLAADHLWGLGHRHLTVLVDRSRPYESADVIAGLRHAFGEAVVEVLTDGTRTWAVTALASPATLHPDSTAVVALTMPLALGALTGLRHRGVTVPARLSVLGFGHPDDGADTLPAVTTLVRPDDRLGEAALQAALDGDGHQPSRTLLAPKLLVRGSTGPAAGFSGSRR